MLRDSDSPVILTLFVSSAFPLVTHLFVLQRCMESAESLTDPFCFQPRKKRDKLQMKPIRGSTATEYGSLSVKVSGYDMTVVEHYSQYIHNLCNRLGVRVSERFGIQLNLLV